eukprot:CAMPEP_0179141090 /NCGR_PEP_ID=MMETSP0796-20121207/67632_1 /TAXON_ID=73915 /ORGANISM="Pyrodinium bahamense, Strain pbaha01" /LENGTH=116 /DNA_ID=CAMNT_0020840753 /DNA_START=65 /DNA_END=411 /DNA_ORIENTATION=+
MTSDRDDPMRVLRTPGALFACGLRVVPGCRRCAGAARDRLLARPCVGNPRAVLRAYALVHLSADDEHVARARVFRAGGCLSRGGAALGLPGLPPLLQAPLVSEALHLVSQRFDLAV